MTGPMTTSITPACGFIVGALPSITRCIRSPVRLSLRLAAPARGPEWQTFLRETRDAGSAPTLSRELLKRDRLFYADGVGPWSFG